MISFTLSHNYEARSSVGKVVATFGSPELIAGWIGAEGSKFPGYTIVKVSTRVTETLLFADQEEAVAA